MVQSRAALASLWDSVTLALRVLSMETRTPSLSVPVAIATPLTFALLSFCGVEQVEQSWGTGHLINKCEVTQMRAG